MGNDAHWLSRLRNGERAAFEELLDRYGARVQKLARRYASTAGDAEDLTQEIFLDLFQSLPSFRGEAQLSTWIYRVALNHCLKWREKALRESERRDIRELDSNDTTLETACLSPEGDPQQQLARGELAQKLHAALDSLSAPHREIVVLHELHGLTYSQCAAVLDVPVGTVKSRLWNAFRLLRRHLAPYVGEEFAASPQESPSIEPKPAGGAA